LQGLQGRRAQARLSRFGVAAAVLKKELRPSGLCPLMWPTRNTYMIDAAQ